MNVYVCAKCVSCVTCAIVGNLRGLKSNPIIIECDFASVKSRWKSEAILAERRGQSGFRTWRKQGARNEVCVNNPI